MMLRRVWFAVGRRLAEPDRGHLHISRRRSAGPARDGGIRRSSRSEVDVVTDVSTDGLEVKDREAFWRQAIAETFVPALVGEAGSGPLGGSIRATCGWGA
jgi:hypothetical protein